MDGQNTAKVSASDTKDRKRATSSSLAGKRKRDIGLPTRTEQRLPTAKETGPTPSIPTGRSKDTSPTKDKNEDERRADETKDTTSLETAKGTSPTKTVTAAKDIPNNKEEGIRET